MITLRNAGLKLEIVPERGGGIARFDWNSLPIFLPARHENCPTGLSSFPLVPFSNRIADGKFTANGRPVALPPNYPPVSTHHAIHGYGWLHAWDITAQAEDTATLRYNYTGPDWPWPFIAEQRFELKDTALRQSLSVRNCGNTNMPAGLGFHPYFPRRDAVLTADFGGFWHASPDGLPTEWEAIYAPPGITDPAAAIDNIFTGRKGDITIAWPTHKLTIMPDQDLPETIIYAPGAGDFFCIEPVSHITNAINTTGMHMLSPGEKWETGVTFEIKAR